MDSGLDETTEAPAEAASCPVGSLGLIDSVTLTRLLGEVRNSIVEPTAYNRTHNRHNRT